MPVRILATLLGALAVCGSLVAAPLGTAFSYQGHLVESGVAAQGDFDLRFQLFSSETGGTPWTAPATNSSIQISNGIFTTMLDFGTNVFSSANCWLEIGVRRAGAPVPFTTLAPRQLLTPAPFSVYTLRAESLNGPLPEVQLPTNVARLNADQTFRGAVNFIGPIGVGTPDVAADLQVHGNVRGRLFTGDGAALSNVSASAISARLAERMWRVPIPFVAVTNAGNSPDPSTGKGAVAYNFRFGKFEINNYQYTAFLNAMASDDPHALYATNMTTDVHGGIIRSGVPGEFIYTVKPNSEHLPAVWMTFPSVLRFCNWLHNGQPTGPQDASTTEDGAYTMTLAAELANTITRNARARFWIPSDDEWYKAAYHQPTEDGGPATGYWRFPTRSDDVPIAEIPPGGINSQNACCETGRQATPVGAYLLSRGYYGTFDQAANVQEWTEEIVFVTNRRLRGGSWTYGELYSQSDDFEFDTPDYNADGIGFRVAGSLEP